jgi:hypothetical protein
MVTKLTLPPVEVTEGMLDLATELDQLAEDIRSGRVRGCAVAWVESGPDMNVSSNWCIMSGKATLTGGLYRLLNAVSSA